MLKYSESELIGNKKKLTEIKKKFQVDKFNSVLNSPRKYPSGKINTSKHFDIFDVLEKETKVDITFFDEFTIKLGLINFFKKISTNLVYEPIIGFLHEEPYFTTTLEQMWYCKGLVYLLLIAMSQRFAIEMSSTMKDFLIEVLPENLHVDGLIIASDSFPAVKNLK